jgi:hypothetical protein
MQNAFYYFIWWYTLTIPWLVTLTGYHVLYHIKHMVVFVLSVGNKITNISCIYLFYLWWNLLKLIKQLYNEFHRVYFLLSKPIIYMCCVLMKSTIDWWCSRNDINFCNSLLTFVTYVFHITWFSCLSSYIQTKIIHIKAHLPLKNAWRYQRGNRRLYREHTRNDASWRLSTTCSTSGTRRVVIKWHENHVIWKT